MQNVLYSISVGNDAIKQSVGYVPLADFNGRIYIVNNQGSSYVYENQDVYMIVIGNDIIGSTRFYASPSGYAGMTYSKIASIYKEEVGYNVDYPQLAVGNNLSIRQSGSTNFLDTVGISIYSLSEQNTGIKWIDGKDLYVMTIYTTITATSTTPGGNLRMGTLANLSSYIGNYDTVLGDVSMSYFLDSGNNIKQFIALQPHLASDELEFIVLFDNSNVNAYITVYYTKSTTP